MSRLSAALLAPGAPEPAQKTGRFRPGPLPGSGGAWRSGDGRPNSQQGELQPDSLIPQNLARIAFSREPAMPIPLRQWWL